MLQRDVSTSLDLLRQLHDGARKAHAFAVECHDDPDRFYWAGSIQAYRTAISELETALRLDAGPEPTDLDYGRRPGHCRNCGHPRGDHFDQDRRHCAGAQECTCLTFVAAAHPAGLAR